MNLTGPLGKQYCLVFKLIALFSLVYLVLATVAIVYLVIASSPNKSMFYVLLLNLPIQFVTYLSNRMLYNMCLQ